MENFNLEGTKSTPEVKFDADENMLIIRGQSYPENAFKFYEPILNWVGEYLNTITEDTQVNIQFSLPYINTSSSKCFMMLLEMFEEAYEDGKAVQLKWFYHEDNESELECAEEFKEDLTFPFEILPIIEEE